MASYGPGEASVILLSKAVNETLDSIRDGQRLD